MKPTSPLNNPGDSAAYESAALFSIWEQFTRTFRGEADCLRELLRRAGSTVLASCGRCGHQRSVPLPVKRLIKCRNCKRKAWATAGTFFQRIRRARPWLAAIWLMEHGVKVSCSKFQKLAGIAYSSAWNIFKKLQIVLESNMGDEALVVPASWFSAVLCKRSRETPARVHPRAELCDDSQIASTENHPLAADGSCRPAAGASAETCTPIGHSDAERKVYECLSSDAILVDQLCVRTGMSAHEVSGALAILELAGLVTRQVGGRYTRHGADAPDQAYDATSGCKHDLETSDEVLEYVRSTFHGISRKYLQSYLAAYWCHSDRMRWQGGALLEACWQLRPISNADILKYVSPAMVRLVHLS